MAGLEGQTERSASTSEKFLGMKAVLIGATGAIGECLLGELLISKVCGRVGGKKLSRGSYKINIKISSAVTKCY